MRPPPDPLPKRGLEDHKYDSALRHFREEMHLTRGLWDALTAVGYKPYCKVLTRGQVRTIVQFLGEP